MPHARKEFFDLVFDGIGISGPKDMVLARELHILGTWDLLSNVAARLGIDERVVCAMNDERGT